MTQIVLHQPLLDLNQRHETVVLPWPWVWWETRIQPGFDGVLFMQTANDFSDPQTAHRITFGADGDAVTVTDPPAIQLVIVEQDPRPITVPIASERELFRFAPGPKYMTVRVVWHEPPGQLQSLGNLLINEAWSPLPVRTCRVGEYRTDIIQSSAYRPLQEAYDEDRYPLPIMPALRWPETPTLRNGEPTTPDRSVYAASPALWMSWWAEMQASQMPHVPTWAEPVPNPPLNLPQLSARPEGEPRGVVHRTARHRPKAKVVEPIPTSGRRTIDGINDDAVIARIDELISEELEEGEPWG